MELFGAPGVQAGEVGEGGVATDEEGTPLGLPERVHVDRKVEGGWNSEGRLATQSLTERCRSRGEGDPRRRTTSRTGTVVGRSTLGPERRGGLGRPRARLMPEMVGGRRPSARRFGVTTEVANGEGSAEAANDGLGSESSKRPGGNGGLTTMSRGLTIS